MRSESAVIEALRMHEGVCVCVCVYYGVSERRESSVEKELESRERVASVGITACSRPGAI